MNDRYLLKYVKKYLFRLILVFFLNLLGMAFAVVLPLVFKYLIDVVVARGMIGMIRTFSIVLILLFLFSSAMDIIGKLIFVKLAIKVEQSMKEDVFQHVLRIPLSRFNERPKGDYIARILQDVSAVIQFFYSSLYPAVLNGILLIVVPVILLKLHVLLGLFCLLTLPLFVIISLSFGARIQKINTQVRKNTSIFVERLDEGLLAVVINKIYNFYRYQFDFLRNFLGNLMQSNYRLSVAKVWASQLFSFISTVLPILILLYGGYLIIKGELTVGALVSFISYLSFLYNPVMAVSKVHVAYKEASVSFNRIKELLSIAPEIPADADDPAVQKDPLITDDYVIKGKIEFKNVSFSYNRQPVLKGIDAVIEPGQITALVGNNGSGKSTFIKLIPGLYKPCGGSIAIDGIDADRFHLLYLRDRISYVPQDKFLYAAGIRDNIRVGNMKATEKEVNDLMNFLRLDPVIGHLEKNCRGNVGPNGCNLSGGEKQRVTLARALLRDCPILLLDEATSEIDRFSEEVIWQTLSHLRGQKTILMITHNLSYLQEVDQILFFENGTCHQGSFDELYAGNKNFRRTCGGQPLIPVSTVNETGGKYAAAVGEARFGSN